MSFKYEGEIKTLANKQTLRKFVGSSPTLQEILSSLGWKQVISDSNPHTKQRASIKVIV